MQDMYTWGIDVIHYVQQIKSPTITTIISFITNFGDVYFYLPALLFLFWCVNEKKAFRLTTTVLLSVNLNNIIKYALCIPRPFFIDPSVKIGFDPTYSTPSGHAQQSVAFWGTAAVLSKNTTKNRQRLLWIALFVVPLIIGFTRVYLGVHYPTDVFFGWAAGAFMTVLAWLLIPLAERHIAPLPERTQLLVIAFIAYVANMFCPQDSSMPGLFFGFAAGYVLLCSRDGFCAASGTVTQKILRCVVGTAIAAAVYGVFLLIPDEAAESQRRLYRFAKYAMIGVSLSYIAPTLFVRLHLANPQKQNNENRKNTPNGENND